MSKMIAFWKQEDGLTTVEYAIAGALVGLFVVTMFTNLGKSVGNVINNIIGVLNTAAGA